MLIKITVNIILVFLTQTNAVENTYQVTVEQGTLAGQLIDLVTGEGQYYSFKGIPYAQPPIGALRFKAPLPAEAWNGIRNAFEHGPVCPQLDFLTNEYIPGNEDCLFVNVYTPKLTPDAPLPVIVFIHGGSYKSGSGNDDYYGPDFLVRKDIVLVTINYRLDALGFLCLDTEDVPGNAGLKDQVLALQWVKANIAKFGGDPNQVTIMGQSAGSSSVGLHLVSPMSTGLFHRVIGLSGSPYSDWAMGHRSVRRAFKLGKQLGFETQDPNALLLFLQNVPSEQLVKYKNPNVLASEEITGIPTKFYQFLPVIEKYNGEDNFLSVDIFKYFNHVNDADILFGYTNQEELGTLAANQIPDLMRRFDSYVENFAPTKILQYFSPEVCLKVGTEARHYYLGNKSLNEGAMREFIEYLNDVDYKYDIIKYFAKIPTTRSKYMYQFSAVSNRTVYGQSGVPYNIIGNGHLDDLMYLFDPKVLNLPLGRNSLEFEIVDRFTSIIKNFVYSGYPKPCSSKLSSNVIWPEFDNAAMLYMDIGTTNLKVLSINDEPFYNFWLTLLYSVGLIY